MSPNHQGKFLTELPRYFHEYRAAYIEWAAVFNLPAADLLAHYRRAIIGWYEACIRPTQGYRGDVYDYVTTVAEAYIKGATSAEPLTYQGLITVGDSIRQDPLHFLPRAIQLSETQQLMLRQFREMGKKCREVILMADYHLLDSSKIAAATGLEGQIEEVRSRRRKCLLMVREHWQSVGILDPVLTPSPADELLIDRYYGHQLSTAERWEVEARRPGDAVFRRGMELREDWDEVVTVAGRQDLMETLEREEDRYATAAPVTAAAAPEVKLTRRKRGGLTIGQFHVPGLQTVVATLLFLALAWLVFDTFGGKTGDSLYRAHFQPFPNIFDRYAPRDAAERDLQQILYYYDRREYRTAYDELLPVAQAYPAAPLYLGVTALALEEPARAQDWLVQIPPDDPYYAYAQWYEALALLGTGRRPAAAVVLEEILAVPGHPFRDRAQRLLAEL